MGITGTNKLETCKHVKVDQALWIRNDQNGPPVLFLGGLGGNLGVFLTLTNQTIYARCSTCFAGIIAEAKSLGQSIERPST